LRLKARGAAPARIRRRARQRATIHEEDFLTEPERLQPMRPFLAALWLAVAGLVAGCGRSPAPAAPAMDAPVGDRDYVAPPELLGVAAAGSGGLELVGSASPGARVRLDTPRGEAAYAVADAGGAWRFTLPASQQPRLLGLSMSSQGRIVQAKGLVFLAPEGVAARLRAGGGSETLGAASPGFAVSSLDYDSLAQGAMAATLAGRAASGDGVTVRVDGIERGQAVADRGGDYVVALSEPLSAGSHDFDLISSRGELRFTAPVQPASPLAGAAYRASRTPLGWRVDWVTPGGGEQTTVLIEPGAAP
jgi:hypothetical protein